MTKVELEEELDSAVEAMENALDLIDPEEGDDPDLDQAVDVLSQALGLEPEEQTSNEEE